LSSLDIFDKQIGEPGNMSRVFKDYMRSDAGGIDLEHFFFEYKVFPPDLF
jgi:hypothetical protein